jgi:beta-glucanase (GH16 family)
MQASFTAGVPSPPVAGPTGIPGNWTVVMHDEFEGTVLNNELWNTQYPWGEDNNGDGSDNCYLSRNAALNGNGILVLTGRKGEIEGIGRNGTSKSWPYNSGQVNTFRKFSLQYGAVEIRAKVPKGPGAWPAFWALPADGSWPPEVDVMEMYGKAPNVLEMTYHWGGADDPQEQHADTRLSPPADLSEAFHVYGCEMSPDAISWYLDGEKQWSFTKKEEISQLKPLYLVCNLAIGGLSGDPSGNTWSQEYLVDYIRAWTPTHS